MFSLLKKVRGKSTKSQRGTQETLDRPSNTQDNRASDTTQGGSQHPPGSQRSQQGSQRQSDQSQRSSDAVPLNNFGAKQGSQQQQGYYGSQQQGYYGSQQQGYGQQGYYGSHGGAQQAHTQQGHIPSPDPRQFGQVGGPFDAPPGTDPLDLRPASAGSGFEAQPRSVDRYSVGYESSMGLNSQPRTTGNSQPRTTDPNVQSAVFNTTKIPFGAGNRAGNSANIPAPDMLEPPDILPSRHELGLSSPDGSPPGSAERSSGSSGLSPDGYYQYPPTSAAEAEALKSGSGFAGSAFGQSMFQHEPEMIGDVKSGGIFIAYR